MLSPYRSILSHPGTKAFAAAGLLSRLPIAMFNISFILMIQIEYNSYEMAGRVAAIGIVCWALQTVPTSRLVDRIGQRAAMIPLAVVHVIGVALGVWAATSGQAEWVLWIAVMLASIQGPLGSLTRARWSNILHTDKDIHTAFALEGALDEVLFISGPALATILATTVWAPMGLVVSAVGMVVGLAILLAQTATEPPTRAHTGGSSLGLKVPAAVVAATFIAFGLGLMFGAFDISVVGFSEEQGFKSWSGVLLGIVAAGSFVGGLLYGTRHWRTALWKRTVLGTVALAVGMTAVAFAPSVWAFAVIGFLAGLAIAPTLTNADTIVQRMVRRDQITEGMSWLRIGMGIGVAIGAWAAGYLVDHVGAHAGLYLAAGSAIAMFGMALVAAPVIRKGTERPEVRDSDDVHPPSQRDPDEWVEQPPIGPNV
ncbi:MFS transporter [Demequina sp.]|uniref:MFS transporter n=1 Tax=Demequina sp. TaxID=2050685 RepID=UPI003A860C65